MFGYVVINKPDIRFKDYDIYNSFYCGLCRCLKSEYGPKGQITLNYDLTFLAILLSGLYEPKSSMSECKCIAHPFEKHPYISNEFIEYAADMNVLLTYYKCIDDWQDDRKVKSKLFSDLLRKAGKNISKKYPMQAQAIKAELKSLEECEASDLHDIDKVSGCFGRLLGTVFVYRQDEWSDYLYKTGFYLGKFIYILDAYCDFEEDIKKGRYNALTENTADADFVRDMLTMMMSECSQAYDMLPIIEYADILENIIYSGVWSKFATAQDKATNENTAQRMK